MKYKCTHFKVNKMIRNKPNLNSNYLKMSYNSCFSVLAAHLDY